MGREGLTIRLESFYECLGSSMFQNFEQVLPCSKYQAMSDKYYFDVENSQFICCTNQLTGF